MHRTGMGDAMMAALVLVPTALVLSSAIVLGVAVLMAGDGDEW